MCVSHMISAALALAAGLSLPVVGRARAFRTPSRPISISNSGAAQRVLVTDGLAPAALDALAAGGADVTSRSLTEDELCAGALAAYDAVIIRSATTLRADALSAGAAGRLRVVGRAGVGVDNIDVAGAHASGVTVVNTPSASTASVVEMTLALLFAAARNLPAADRGLRSGEWLKPPARGEITRDYPRLPEITRARRAARLGAPRLSPSVRCPRLSPLHRLAAWLRASRQEPGPPRVWEGCARRRGGGGRPRHARVCILAACGVRDGRRPARCDYSHSVCPLSTRSCPPTPQASPLGVTLLPSAEELFCTCSHVSLHCALTPQTRLLVGAARLKRHAPRPTAAPHTA